MTREELERHLILTTPMDTAYVRRLIEIHGPELLDEVVAAGTPWYLLHAICLACTPPMSAGFP